MACLAVHAEHLHVDVVWRHVINLARIWTAAERPITLFVHPFWSVTAGFDITARVRRLATLGHEIGQHTHYYDFATGRSPGHTVLTVRLEAAT